MGTICEPAADGGGAIGIAKQLQPRHALRQRGVDEKDGEAARVGSNNAPTRPTEEAINQTIVPVPVSSPVSSHRVRGLVMADKEQLSPLESPTSRPISRMRWRFQFSLRSGLIAVTAFSVAMAVLVWIADARHESSQANPRSRLIQHSGSHGPQCPICENGVPYEKSPAKKNKERGQVNINIQSE